MYHDFIMDEIERMTRALGKVLFNKELDRNDLIDLDAYSITEGNLLKINLSKLLSEKKINEAENLLFNELDTYLTQDKVEVGFWFYQKLHGYSDAELNAVQFSRQEIYEGLKDLEEKALLLKNEQ